ncbi:ImmA/IrrE family metallo-endopeptidase [Clostridium sp.]|uniref:ImmA/IrrE family metallo-endopeptidase n=1 Tax=Clostridium sp. TaxID=1506 RepID=UPI00284784CD|nr:ImmA/IrrE family metallo-endopeptidase [Clostridium sp.]MDR3596874.1 ImmA/IrrE family metallo-endopeptidase [Clostridium sp.]
MSVKGFRVKKTVHEPALLGNLNNIIQEAKRKGLISGYKVDIKAIIQDNGLIFEESDLPSSISGYLKYLDGKWIIGVNKNHNSKRQRFTIAHEFGHYILHRREGTAFEDTTFFRKSNESSIEYKANEFAAEILMPEEMIKKAIQNGIKKIDELAEQFGVSVQAIKYRANELGYYIRSSE